MRFQVLLALLHEDPKLRHTPHRAARGVNTACQRAHGTCALLQQGRAPAWPRAAWCPSPPALWGLWRSWSPMLQGDHSRDFAQAATLPLHVRVTWADARFFLCFGFFGFGFSPSNTLKSSTASSSSLLEVENVMPPGGSCADAACGCTAPFQIRGDQRHLCWQCRRFAIGRVPQAGLLARQRWHQRPVPVLTPSGSLRVFLVAATA